MPTDAEMVEVNKLIEARMASRYMREDGVVEDDTGTAWSGEERVIESIDGKLTWADLDRFERMEILESNVTWKGFTPEQEQDVIGNVISGLPSEIWMDGVLIERQAEDATAIDFDMTGVNGRLESERAPRGWEFAETSVDDLPDSVAEPLTPELAKEWRIDYEAARLRDAGQDYEGFLRQANPDLIDHERSLRQSASRPKEQEKDHER